MFRWQPALTCVLQQIYRCYPFRKGQTGNPHSHAYCNPRLFVACRGRRAGNPHSHAYCNRHTLRRGCPNATGNPHSHAYCNSKQMANLINLLVLATRTHMRIATPSAFQSFLPVQLATRTHMRIATAALQEDWNAQNWQPALTCVLQPSFGTLPR